MAEASGTTAANQATAQELEETIAEFERYRDRLFTETVEAAKRAKLSKSATMAKLEPELAKIDATIETLRQQQAILISGNQVPS